MRKSSWKEMRDKYPKLFKDISNLLFIDDPMNINYETNTDEYDVEAGYIISKLINCTDQSDVQKNVYDVFKKCFSKTEIGIYGNYEKIACEIWKIWEEWNEK
jgi:hypothetical protein